MPVDDAIAVRRYTRFRKLLIQSGYQMLQYSVYCKICPNRDTVKWHMDYLTKHLPSDGSIMVLMVTEKQYQSIQHLVGTKKLWIKNNYSKIAEILRGIYGWDAFTGRL